MGETVEQRPGRALGAEGPGPFVEGEVGGDERSAPLVALRDQLEQKLGAVLLGGTKPNSSMIGSVPATICFWSRGRRRSSRASINSCTSVAAVVKPVERGPSGWRPVRAPGRHGSCRCRSGPGR